MSSLLRGTRLLLSHTLRKITRVASSRGHYRLPKDHLPWTSPVFTRNLSADVAPVPAAHKEAPEAVGGWPLERLSDVQRRLELMDSNVRWRRRVDREDVQAVLELMKNGDDIPDQQALMLLRCAGSLMVKENRTKRMEIFNDMWNTMKQRGVAMKTSHYNTAIRIQLENKHAFVATDILSEMESSNDTKPNRVTFQLLVERYCQVGDLNGATTVLQHMKGLKLPITEAVFNQLIICHLKNGDAEGAKEVLESMRSLQLQPTSETYKGILCCHAEKGDMNAIRQTLDDAEQAEVHIPASHLYATLIVMAENGYHSLIEQLLTLIRLGANHDALNTVHQLIAYGQDDSAFLVYSHLTPDDCASDTVQSGSRNIIRTMILNDRPIDQLKSMLDKLKESERLDDDIGLITRMSLIYKKPDLALDSIKVMKESEHPVRPHYFWPILIQYLKAKNINGVYNTIALLVDTAEKNEDYIPTLYDSVFCPLVDQLKDSTAVVARLREAGVQTADVNTIQLLHLISSGNLTEAKQFLESNLDITFHVEAFKQALISIASPNLDKIAVCKVTALLQERCPGSRGFFSGIMLNSMLSRKFFSTQDKIDIAQTWADESLQINSLSLERVKSLLAGAGAPDTLIQKLADTAINERSRALETLEARSLPVNKLESELLARRPHDRDVNIIRKHLLNKYCSAGDVENADTLRASLEEEKGFVFDASTLRQLGYLAAMYKKDLDEALMYKQQMEASHPDFSHYQQFALAIAILQAEKRQFTDAIQTLVMFGNAHGDAMAKLKSEERLYSFMHEVNVLLTTFASGAKPVEMRHLADTLFKHSFTMSGMYSVLVEVVSAYISNEDLDGLMDVLKLYYNDYQRVPIFQDVFRALIAQKESKKLEQVVDMVTNITDSGEVLLKLAIACIDCEQTSKAAKIMETPGLRANMTLLKTTMDNYIRLGKEKELRELVDVTRVLFGVDREEMLFGIVRFYAGKKDADECQSVLVLYEEQNVVPAPRTLRYIANVLIAQEKEVHFDVPAILSGSRVKENKNEPGLHDAWTPTTINSNQLEKRASTAALTGDMPDLFNALNSATKAEPISAGILNQIASQLYRDNEGRNFTRFLRELKEDQLWCLVDDAKMSRQSILLAKKELLHKYITGKLDNAEKKALILEDMRANPGLVNTYFASNNTMKAISETDPELFNEVVSLIDQRVETHPRNIKATQALFEYYIEKNMDREAEELISRNIEFHKQVRMNIPARILQNAALDSKDETRLMWLLNLAKKISVRKTAPVYSNLVALRSETDLPGALQAVEDAHAAGLAHSDLFIPIMRTLEEKLVAAKMEVPWTPGSFSQNRQL